jgi:hypothetical protein
MIGFIQLYKYVRALFRPPEGSLLARGHTGTLVGRTMSDVCSSQQCCMVACCYCFVFDACITSCERNTAALPVPATVRATVARCRAAPPVDSQPWVCPQQQRRARPEQTTAAPPSSPPTDSHAATAGSADSSTLGTCLRYQAGHYWNSDYIMVIFTL